MSQSKDGGSGYKQNASLSPGTRQMKTAPSPPLNDPNQASFFGKRGSNTPVMQQEEPIISGQSNIQAEFRQGS